MACSRDVATGPETGGRPPRAIGSEAAKSEILNDGSKTIVTEVGEWASSPLISEKSTEVRKGAIQQNVKY